MLNNWSELSTAWRKKKWQIKITSVSVRKMTIWWLELASDFWVSFNTSIAAKTLTYLIYIYIYILSK
jgi:hypothetical protein